jgi:hypothetical protein
MTVALPGESLWSLARALVSADRGILAAELAGNDPAIYGLWHRLTDLNGVRELEVGERVMIPLPESELAGMAKSNAEDLARIEEGARALARGDLEGAVLLCDQVRGDFARGTERLRTFEEALVAAREDALKERASAAVSQAATLSRSSDHREILRLLGEAREALIEAGELAAGTRHVGEIERIEDLLTDARRFRVGDDGSVVAMKHAGTPYTEAARETVEWFLRRELVSSGMAFPYHDEKTRDEIGWARFLGGASDMARADGLDFASLLESVGEEIEIRLPSPARYFTE